ncbi:MAG: aconitate hydratase [Spirochaetae bacterium HGW-Spirochaetae-1]|jgi:aconitate hydratase|nr:MAG: aconitate hydratase [Spirochaetae bacterium HGW-Spirochaetae-1]
MGTSVTYKILKDHLVEGELKPGNEIGIRIDQTLTQDATGTMAYLQFEAMGISRVRTEISVSYVDHNTLQMGFENADDHKYLQTMNAGYGIYYSRAGNGICHQVHLERFGRPGATLLGSDSHTPTGGGIGMIAMGAGGLDVAVAMGGGPFFITAPKVINVRLTGKLRPWVAAKDVILKVLEILTTKGNVGCVVEYTGPGIETLSVPERATITNMGAELGVTTSVFPSDEITRTFLRAQGREQVWKELLPDKDAPYERIIDIDLSGLEPMVACPHSPDNIKKVSDLKGMSVDQVAIGSCTNSSYKDLMIVAGILKGKKIHPGVSLVVAPGSKQVFEMISRSGALTDMIAAGARIMESACGFCIGSGQAPVTGGISLRTNNRNFEGRSGTASGQIYLISPETAALSALTGKLENPLDYTAADYPDVAIPDAFIIDDSMILPPSEGKVEIFRGPNIGDPPYTDPLMDDIHGVVGLKVGDKITTDHIMPAGQRLKYRSNIPKYSQFVFEGVDADFSRRALDNKEKGIYTAIAGGQSYGQGSSREHAAICPMYLGVRLVMVKSFERIHSGNLINFGIVPLVFADEADYDSIGAGDPFSVRDFRRQVAENDVIQIEIGGKAFGLKLFASSRQRKILLDGGLLNYTKKQA